MAEEEETELPVGVVLRCKAAMRKFQREVTDLAMPMIDVDAVMSEVIDAINVRDDSNHELIVLAHAISETDMIYENVHLDDGQQERIHTAVMLLGKELKREIDFHQGYHKDGRFPYKLERLINNDTLVLKRKVE